MKLFSVPHSPFAARVRLAIYDKQLPIEICAPPTTGLKSDGYLAINPMGKLPALVLDDGTAIVESDTIVEFLADVFSDRNLRPSDVVAAARGRTLARIVDLYAMPAGAPLIAKMARPAEADEIQAATFAKLEQALGWLEAFMPSEGYAAAETLTTADCALVPMLFYVEVFASVFSRGELVSRFRRLDAYGRRLQRNLAVQTVLEELNQALSHLI